MAVGVVPVPARSADEDRLVLAALAVHGPTGRAGLRRVGRIDPNDPSNLVSQHRLDLVPANAENRTVEPALLRHVATRCSEAPARRSRHVLGAQSLYHDTAVAPGDVSGGLMRPVLADACLPSLEGRGTALRLYPSPGAALAARDSALRPSDSALVALNVERQPVGRAVRQHQRHGNPTNDAYAKAVVGRVAVKQAADADLPSERGARHGRLADRALDGTRQTEAHPSDFRQAHAAPAAIDLLGRDLPARKGKGIVCTFLLRLWIAAETSPRAAVSLVQCFKRALLRCDVNRAHEVKLGAQRGQFACLRDVVQIISRFRLVASPVVATLFKSEVPNQAAHACKLRHRRRLFRRGAERVAVSAKSPANLCGIRMVWMQEKERGFRPGLKARVSAAKL